MPAYGGVNHQREGVVQPEVRASCSPIIIGPAVEVIRQANALSLNADFPAYQEDNSGQFDLNQPLFLDTGTVSEIQPASHCPSRPGSRSCGKMTAHTPQATNASPSPRHAGGRPRSTRERAYTSAW